MKQRPSMEQTNIAGLRMLAVDVATLKENPWNPNVMDEQMFAKEVRSITDHGFIDPITVREHAGGFQIIDGAHRWKAAKQLGIAQVPATNLGSITDEKAKKLTILYNELRGQPEPVRLAHLLKDLALTSSVAQLAEELPMTSVEIDTLIKSTDDYTWKTDEDLTAGVSNEGREHADTNEKKFQMGSVRGVLPQWLSEKLQAEFKRSADVVRSKNPETVMRDWLARLEATAPAPVRPSAPPPAPAPAVGLVRPSEGTPTRPEVPRKKRGVRKPEVRP